jgi:NAD(P)-dependent dehydrogenase (short-subunit alcohol dehydrogenase family)
MEKAALRNLTFSLAEELAPLGIRVGTVTILGAVAPGTMFDPARIAEVFYALHADRDASLGVETAFSG